MEAVREVIDSNLLNGVISLPEKFRNQKVEVIVFLGKLDGTNESAPTKKKDLASLTKADVDEMFKGSIAESLIGIIPDTGMTLEDYRAERLKKYECAN